MDTRSRVSIWADAAYRYSLITFGSKSIPLFVVTEFPKSGGTWVAQMLAELLEIPFPRNNFFVPRKSILHAHLCFSKRISNVVCILRDGRDVMVSLYYHNFFESEKNSPILVRNMRNSMPFDDYDDIRSNLPTFLHFMHSRLAGSVSPYRFTWGEFVKSWYGKHAIMASYEDFLIEPVNTLNQILQQLEMYDVPASVIEHTVAKYSFKSQSNRAPGEEDTRSFLRKGVAGDWKDKFNAEAAQIFDEFYGEQLIQAGYERNRNWVENAK